MPAGSEILLTVICSSSAAARAGLRSLAVHHQAAGEWPLSSWHSGGNNFLPKMLSHACDHYLTTPFHTSTLSWTSDLK